MTPTQQSSPDKIKTGTRQGWRMPVCFFNFRLREAPCHITARCFSTLVSVDLRPLIGIECNADREKLKMWAGTPSR
jgi:hypothetical protein